MKPLFFNSLHNVHEEIVIEMTTIKEQRMIDSMFNWMNKEDKLFIVAQKVQVLSKKIQMHVQQEEKTTKSLKWLVGGP